MFIFRGSRILTILCKHFINLKATKKGNGLSTVALAKRIVGKCLSHLCHRNLLRYVLHFMDLKQGTVNSYFLILKTYSLNRKYINIRLPVSSRKHT